MGIVKKVIKTVSTTIGELLVVGGALGTTYVLGFIKGSEIKPKVKEVIDDIGEKVKATEESTVEESAEESEPESEEEVGPSIEVTHNNRTED
jgi:hypothetical protein